jgi:UDP-N-acetylmuramoyl-tripeptide--D-alanyl-D-alanine ligase
MDMSIADILSATGGTLLSGGDAARVCDIGIDSRAVGPRTLFVPLRGAHHDGHTFIESSFTQGAPAALTEHADAVCMQRFPDSALIRVESALRALGDIAACWRRNFSIPVIGITGSNGKTTTKEMVAAIIVRGRSCLKNEGNFNNLIGLPLSVAGLAAGHQAAVFEMGMSEPGEIRRLAEIAAPTIGVITNVGPCHLEQLGSLEAIAAAKAELFEALGPGDVAIINNDDDRVRPLAAATAARVITFGLTHGDVHAADVRQLDTGGSLFTLYIADACVPVRLELPGEHFISNALAAAAAAHAAGIGPGDIAAGLCSCAPLAGRMQRLELGGLHIINDAYNANPVSMRAALTALRAAGRGSRTIAVLGDMLELGARADEYHREIGACVARAGIDRVLVLGAFALAVCEGAREAGMSGDRICACDSLDGLAEALSAAALPGDVVLLKGSRGMRLERLLDLLRPTGAHS